MTNGIVNSRVVGTRITVWDVLHYLERGWSVPEIAETLRLSTDQVQAAVDYIHENRDEVMKVHRQIEARTARGNPPEIKRKLAASRARRRRWMKSQASRTPQERNRARHSS